MFYESRFRISPVLPFRLDLTVWALRRRQKNRIDSWDGVTYTRVFVDGSDAVQCQVVQNDDVLEITVKSLKLLKDSKLIITNNIVKMLGLDVNIGGFYQLPASNTHLQILKKSFLGVKPPRFPTLFEALLNAISCQQVSLDLGILLLNRLAESYGIKFEDEGVIQYSFPRPKDLRSVASEEIKKLGYSFQKARAIKELTQIMLTGDVLFSDLENMTSEKVINLLSGLHGIGRWSSEYVLLRGLGRLDTFPGDDVGAQKTLQQLLGLQRRPTYEGIKQLTVKWQPYAGLVYFHLLLDKLQKNNLL